MAHAHRILSLRAAEQMTVLPVALISTLPFRVQSDHPDVIVLAASIAGNLSHRTALREVFEDTPTLLLAEEPSTALVRDAARIHIYSVLPFDATAQQMVAAISATVAGFAVTLPRLPTGAPEVAPGVEHLTVREVEILRLMARGQRNKQVAAQLNISQHTVKYHVSAVMAKLGARTRTEAVTIGVMRGLVAI
jgi:two-component system, NarL family, response regulator YdfI